MALFFTSNLSFAGELSSSCTYKGIPLYGKVKIVESFPDACGKWKYVESFPDFKIKFVDSFPDIKIKYVDSFQGVTK